MRIAIYGINYAPELTGIGKYTAEMADWLNQNGHEVFVYTGMPYYPEWKIHNQYKGKLWMKERINNVTIYRCPLYVPNKISAIKRIIHELSFDLSLIPFLIKSFFKKKFDIVICVTPPFHLGIFPLLYSKIKRSRLICHIQDLQIDTAKKLAMIKNKSVLKLMYRLEYYLLRNSDLISTISPGMMKNLEYKNLPVFKLVQFPNWVDTNFITPLPINQSLRSKYNIPYDDKVILYSGNLGEKQGLEILIPLAKYFLENKSIHFLIVGSGGIKHHLEFLAKTHNLVNIKFLPLEKYEDLPFLLASADLHLVLQKKDASDLVMPSKLTGILSAGGCSIVTANPNTSLYNIISENNLGFIAKPEDKSSLISIIERALKSDTTEIKINARKYAINYLSKESIMESFVSTLKMEKN